MTNFTDAQPPRSSRFGSPFRFAMAWLTETLFVTDMLFVGLLVFIVILGGLNPFNSSFMTTLIAVTLVIVPLHAILMWRHRHEMIDAHARHTTRERRGF
jgi:uncharacterized protein YacL